MRVPGRRRQSRVTSVACALISVPARARNVREGESRAVRRAIRGWGGPRCGAVRWRFLALARVAVAVLSRWSMQFGAQRRVAVLVQFAVRSRSAVGLVTLLLSQHCPTTHPATRTRPSSRTPDDPQRNSQRKASSYFSSDPVRAVSSVRSRSRRGHSTGSPCDRRARRCGRCRGSPVGASRPCSPTI